MPLSATPAAQVGTGTFIADATTQNIEIHSLLSGGSLGGFRYMNGYQLRDITAVPEASTALLLGFG